MKLNVHIISSFVLKKGFYFFPIGSIFVSCQPLGNLPVMSHTIPSEIKKNSIEMTVTSSVLANTGHLTYSATDHISFYLSGMMDLSKPLYWESGGIYSINTDSSGKLTFRLSAGYASGKMNFTFHKETGYQLGYYEGFYNMRLDIKQYCYFITPHIGGRATPKLHMFFSLRCNYWIFPIYDYFYEEYKYQGGSSYYGTYATLVKANSYSYRNKALFSLHPAISIMAGGKHIKSFTQVGFEALFNDFIINRKRMQYIRQGIVFFIPIGKRINKPK